MAENEILTDKEIAFLAELIKNKVRFIIIGLSAAALQGAPVVTQDIDLWFENIQDPKIKKILKKVGASFVPQIGLNPPMFAGENVKLFDIVLTVHGLKSFSAEYKNAIDISLGKIKVRVLKLERIIKSKETLKRQKDLLVLPVLKDALATLNLEKGKQNHSN